MNKHKIIGIGTLTNESLFGSFPPKIELNTFRNITFDNDSDEKDKEYIFNEYTKNTVTNLIFESNMTQEILLQKLIDNIDAHKIDLHETYTVLISYSLWEIVDGLMKHKRIDKINKNGHAISPIHKALLPNWLWNYRREIKLMPDAFKRTTDDLVKTIEYLLSNSLIISVLETTPRRNYRTECLWENAIVLITQIIPRELISNVFDKLYDSLVINLSEERIKNEAEYIIQQIPTKIKNNANSDYFKLGNELRWIMTLNPSIFAKEFLNYCRINNITNITERIDVIVEFTKLQPNLDNVFDIFFRKYPWDPQITHSVCSQIFNMINSEKIAK
jgi:hypothetical protein